MSEPGDRGNGSKRAAGAVGDGKEPDAAAPMEQPPIEQPSGDHSSGEHTSGYGKSAVLELEERLQIEADLKLRDVDSGAAAAPTFRPDNSRYEILGTIGAGGMGTVYLGFDHDLKRRVALKVLKPSEQLSRDRVRRFLEEAQATGQLEHPNIVPVYDVGRGEDGRTFYTMRFVQGTSLEGVLRLLRSGDAEARSEYTVTRFLQILSQLAMAVHFAHEKGVLHRDLKPSNIMLGGYGEVFLMDWGLARILGREEPGRKLIGTPAYMSPEQASGKEIGPESDVFALGVILYKCLTLRAPFHGLTLEALLADIRRAMPAPPRRFNARLPAELDRIALKALARSPAERYPTARGFRDALQGFLEGIAERRRRRELAEGLAAEGRRRAAQFLRLREELVRAEKRLADLEAGTPGWLPIEAKAALLKQRRRVERMEEESEQALSGAVEILTSALAQDSTVRTARKTLAQLYFTRFLEAEAEGDQKDKQFFRRLVETYHDGRYAEELLGDGSLEIASQPADADLLLYELVEGDLVLEQGDERYLGKTPLVTKLPMGSFVVVLRRAGMADVRYPVAIERLGNWKGTVRLYSADEIGAGFVYVPAGAFIQGGDRRTMTSLPMARPTQDGFFIATFPVTNREYLEFLNDLAKKEPEEAVRRAPRRGAEGAVYWSLGPAGFDIPEVDAEGDRHHPDWPVLAISWHDAVAYCEWRSNRDGRRYSLPTEAEWEKAARGVDGRVYPWGDHFDPALCNMRESRERAGPVPVGTFKHDVSAYGVRDMAGNCEEWTLDAAGDSRGSRIARGGAWLSNRMVVRCAFRSVVEPHLASGIRGFRIVSHQPAVDS